MRRDGRARGQHRETPAFGEQPAMRGCGSRPSTSSVRGHWRAFASMVRPNCHRWIAVQSRLLFSAAHCRSGSWSGVADVGNPLGPLGGSHRGELRGDHVGGGFQFRQPGERGALVEFRLQQPRVVEVAGLAVEHASPPDRVAAEACDAALFLGRGAPRRPARAGRPAVGHGRPGARRTPAPHARWRAPLPARAVLQVAGPATRP
jgi:hypothetical protein